MNDDAAPQTTGWAILLDRLWHILASPRLSVFLLVWVAGVLVLSVVIPEAPPGIEDPLVRSQWLAEVPSRIRPVAERLYTFGVFDLLDSVWLRLPLVLVLAHALVMLAHCGPGIWHRIRQSPGEVNALGQSFPLEQEWPESIEDVRQKLLGRLERAGYPVFYSKKGKEAAEPAQDTFAVQRWGWNWLGLGGIYLGLGLTSAGLILTGWLGQVQDLYLVPGEPVSVSLSARSAPDLELEETMVTGDNPLRPASGVAVVQMSTGVGETRRLAPKLHRSQLLNGRWLTLAELRPITEVSAVNEETGAPVLLQPFSPRIPPQERVYLPLVGEPETRFIGVPSQNVTLHLAYQENAAHRLGLRDILTRRGAAGEVQTPAPILLISFFRGANPEPSQSESLHVGDEVAFDGVRYRVTFGYAATLRLNMAPWWMLVVFGWGITVLSLVALVLAPPVYVQGDVKSTRQGSLVTLAVDALGDKQQRRQELDRLLDPTIEH